MVEIPDDMDTIKFKNNIKDEESIFSEYVRTDSLQMDKLEASNFEPKEIIDHYRSVDQSEVILPIYPNNVKKVHELFDITSKNWSEMSNAFYGVLNKKTHEFIGCASVNKICWDKNVGYISFRMPENAEYIDEVCRSLCHMCFSLLGLSAVRLRINRNKDVYSEYVDKFVRDSGGEFDGIARENNSDSKLITYNKWSVSVEEFYNETSDYSQHIGEYNGN